MSSHPTDLAAPNDPAAAVPLPEEPQWRTEWAVEVTWADAESAGASGQTSQYGPFGSEAPSDSFLTQMRQDPDIAGTRVLPRQAAYTEWDTSGAVEATTAEEREALLMAQWERIHRDRVNAEHPAT